MPAEYYSLSWMLVLVSLTASPIGCSPKVRHRFLYQSFMTSLISSLFYSFSKLAAISEICIYKKSAYNGFCCCRCCFCFQIHNNTNRNSLIITNNALWWHSGVVWTAIGYKQLLEPWNKCRYIFVWHFKKKEDGKKLNHTQTHRLEAIMAGGQEQMCCKLTNIMGQGKDLPMHTIHLIW